MNEKIDSTIYELDDEDTDLLPTIDSSHQFLNFSRRVTEAASMRKPVDIQLGIACGKDLIFPSFTKRHKPPKIQVQDTASLFSTQVNSSENSLSSTLESDSPRDTIPSPTLSEATVVKEDEPYSEKDYFSDRDAAFFEYDPPKDTYNLSTSNDLSTNELPSFSFSESNLSEDTNSMSLDQLVADVFNYMDSCPNHSAYSEDLRSLKSKLQEYNSSRTSFESDS